MSLQEECVMIYQNTKESDLLVEQYKNFINKYVSLFWNDAIDFSNYDIRCFLSIYIEDKKIRSNLRRGKYHSGETKKSAYKVLQYLKFKLRRHSREDLYSELLIPFLDCAKTYKNKGKGFEKYLYVVYKYELKRHLDEIKLDAMDEHGVIYKSILLGSEWDYEDLPDNLITQNDFDLQLNHPLWIHGNRSSKPFSSLKSHERYILAKYYYEGYTDKEIARMLPYNPKSIHRIRMRLKKHFINLYHEGEIKWIRI